VIRVGTRGPVSTCREVNSERCRTISARELQRFGPSVLEDAIPAGLPCYVSIDLDVLDPSVAPAVGTPVPGGLTLHELEDAVAAVALRARVEALDLVELNPGLMPGNLTACVSSRVLLSALQAIMLSRRERAAELKTQNLEEDRACTA
jgi:arginase family enzyme